MKTDNRGLRPLRKKLKGENEPEEVFIFIFSGEVEEQEANDFLKQPVVKIANLNKNLKRSYEKGFLDESKYEFIQTLRKIRKHPDQDSVSSHYGSD